MLCGEAVSTLETFDGTLESMFSYPGVEDGPKKEIPASHVKNVSFKMARI